MGVAVGAGERVGLWRWGRLLFHLKAGLVGFDSVYFGKNHGEFLLEITLGGLVVFVGEFADAVFELEVAQVFVDGGLALVEVRERRNWLRFRKVLRPNSEYEDDDNDRQDAGNCDDHRKQILAADERR